MMVLALDTTTAAGSVAIAEDDRVLEVAPIDPSVPVAARVPADLVALLDRRSAALGRIDVFAVAVGPGSFTGLRIGIAAMQGLALAQSRPLVGVSSFDALAFLANAPLVSTWIDAWRGEVYAAEYENGVLLRPPVVFGPAQALEATRHHQAPFIGDGAIRYRELLRHVIEPTPLLAGAVASLAHARAAAGELPPPHAIRPLYVRRPDAELARDGR
jgi:tRNA threonylcarbamoyladenosine biosynthesis protein TsaB